MCCHMLLDVVSGMMPKNVVMIISISRYILELPPSEATVVECELTEAERDFYDALYKKSKVYITT